MLCFCCGSAFLFTLSLLSESHTLHSHLLCARIIYTHFCPGGIHLLIVPPSFCIWPFLASFSLSSHHTLFWYSVLLFFFSHAIFPCCSFLRIHYYLPRKEIMKNINISAWKGVHPFPFFSYFFYSTLCFWFPSKTIGYSCWNSPWCFEIVRSGSEKLLRQKCLQCWT